MNVHIYMYYICMARGIFWVPPPNHPAITTKKCQKSSKSKLCPMLFMRVIHQQWTDWYATPPKVVDLATPAYGPVRAALRHDVTISLTSLLRWEFNQEVLRVTAITLGLLAIICC